MPMLSVHAHPLQGDSYDVDMIVRRLEIEGLTTIDCMVPLYAGYTNNFKSNTHNQYNANSYYNYYSVLSVCSSTLELAIMVINI